MEINRVKSSLYTNSPLLLLSSWIATLDLLEWHGILLTLYQRVLVRKDKRPEEDATIYDCYQFGKRHDKVPE